MRSHLVTHSPCHPLKIMKTLFLILTLIMPVTASNAGLLLSPFFEVAELIASTAKWQDVTETASVEDALASIAFTEYVDFESPRQGLIEVPLIVLSDPWDLAVEIFGTQDEQGRVDHGQMLMQLFLQTDPEDVGNLEFYQTLGVLIGQIAALSGKEKPGGAGWYIKARPFQQAFAPRCVPLSNLQCVPRGGDQTKPQQVTTASFVVDWSRS